MRTLPNVVMPRASVVDSSPSSPERLVAMTLVCGAGAVLCARRARTGELHGHLQDVGPRASDPGGPEYLQNGVAGGASLWRGWRSGIVDVGSQGQCEWRVVAPHANEDLLRAKAALSPSVARLLERTCGASSVCLVRSRVVAAEDGRRGGCERSRGVELLVDGGVSPVAWLRRLDEWVICREHLEGWARCAVS